ncbi:MAG: phospholipase D-like domain-containing protein [Candidatus Altiarchaeota archaeon]|nr:phospholipase D-like domain-containing protein [Candidatus Altiarchaeota archaeon]
MKIRDKPVFWILVGVVIGIILTVEVIHFANLRSCPENICLTGSEVIAVSDRGYFPAVHDAFQKAQQSIHIVTFELKYYPKYKGSNQNILIDDLIKAHDRGVDVRIIVDQYSKKNNAYEYLRVNNITIKYDPEDVTTHTKLVIIDGKIVILGSTNFSYYGLEKNNEVNAVIISEEFAQYFEDYFDRLWGG